MYPSAYWVVDDFEDWRQFVCSTIAEVAGLQVIAEASDGVEAVQKASVLKPDLVLLDIGLPKLNGIEAARQIVNCSPESQIVFVTENPSSDVIEECLRAGASGYVVKSSASRDLMPAIQAAIKRQT